MKNKLKWLEAALLAAPLIALLIFWNDLPARVPIHWNLRGEINGWGPKTLMLLPPLLSIGIIVPLHFLPRFDPRLRRTADEHGRMPTVLGILRLALAAFFGVLFWTQLAAGLGKEVAVGRIVPSAILLLVAVIGNYSSNFRPNYFVGIRTPWTMESPETWRATHRLGGRLMFFGSAVLLILQFFIRESTFGITFITSVVLFMVWAFWYPWHHSRTQSTRPLKSSRN